MGPPQSNTLVPFATLPVNCCQLEAVAAHTPVHPIPLPLANMPGLHAARARRSRQTGYSVDTVLVHPSDRHCSSRARIQRKSLWHTGAGDQGAIWCRESGGAARRSLRIPLGPHLEARMTLFLDSDRECRTHVVVSHFQSSNRSLPLLPSQECAFPFSHFSCCSSTLSLGAHAPFLSELYCA